MELIQSFHVPGTTQHVALGAEGGHLSPPHEMRNREDECAETTKKAADVQTQAEMESVDSLAPAIPPVHCSSISGALIAFLLTIPLQHLCIFILHPHGLIKLNHGDICSNQSKKIIY